MMSHDDRFHEFQNNQTGNVQTTWDSDTVPEAIFLNS